MTFRVLLAPFLLSIAGLAQSAGGPARMRPPRLEPVRVGQLKVWMLKDGQVSLEGSLLKGIAPADVRRMLGGREAAMTPVNAFLVQMPGMNVLVDTGLGKDPLGGRDPGEDSGHLVEQLAAAGVKPSGIDLILITHYHFDHVGGLLKADGSRAFPRARLLVPRREHTFWLQEPTSLPERLRSRIPRLKALFSAYEKAGAFHAFAEGEAPAPGIRALAAYGHTGGHTIYAFRSEGQDLWCIGDLVHFGAVQFERPEAGVAFDMEGEEAVRVRQAFFRQAARSKAVLAGAHLSRFVRIEPKGAGYQTLPVVPRP